MDVQRNPPELTEDEDYGAVTLDDLLELRKALASTLLAGRVGGLSAVEVSENGIQLSFDRRITAVDLLALDPLRQLEDTARSTRLAKKVNGLISSPNRHGIWLDFGWCANFEGPVGDLRRSEDGRWLAELD